MGVRRGELRRKLHVRTLCGAVNQYFSTSYRYFSVYIFNIVSIVWSMLSMVLVCICKTVLVPSFVSVPELKTNDK